ncbi:hypothetical protein ACJX0J_014460, partial [Zea mays]
MRSVGNLTFFITIACENIIHLFFYLVPALFSAPFSFSCFLAVTTFYLDYFQYMRLVIAQNFRGRTSMVLRSIAVTSILAVIVKNSHMVYNAADMGGVAMYQDPRDACSAIAAESYKLWLEHENRTDDITIIIVHIRDMENA